MKTVIGLFDNQSQAETAVHDLEVAGITRNDISIVASNANQQYGQNIDTVTNTNDRMSGAIATDATAGATIGGVLGLLAGTSLFAIPGLGWLAGAGWLAGLLTGAGVGAVAGGLIGALVNIGVPAEDAAYYQEGVRRGGVMVAVRAEDANAASVAQILTDSGAYNIDQRAEQWRQEGYQPQNDFLPTPTPVASHSTMNPTTPITTTTTAQTNAFATEATPVDMNRVNREGETVLPVVEEQLQVGKRQVERGGVRVYSHVTEQPVEEQVTLHEERVNVERRPVDRPVANADMAAFKEGTIEVRETAEEAIIAKQARVVEEVVVNKEATDRTETIRDTVRRTDVEVEQLGGHTSRTAPTFESYDAAYRTDWRNRYANLGGAYEDYEPSYHYGYDLANNATYRGRNWSDIEPDVRRDWNTRYPNSWDRFKDSIRYSWDQATGAERGGIKTGGYHTDGSPDQRGIMEKTADAITGDRIDDKTGKPVA